MPFRGENVEPNAVPSRLKESIKTLREAVGPDIEIMIDNHGRSWPSLAIQQIGGVEEYNISFFEEPVPPDNIEALAEVRRNISGTDLATGGRLFSRWDYRRLIEKQPFGV